MVLDRLTRSHDADVTRFKFVALPGPRRARPSRSLRTPAQRNPSSMGLKDHIKRGIPNLNLSRPLFPEGDSDVSIDSENHLVLPTPNSAQDSLSGSSP